MKKIIAFIILLILLYPVYGYAQNNSSSIDIGTASSVMATYTSCYPMLMNPDGRECGWDLNRPYVATTPTYHTINANMNEIPDCSAAEDSWNELDDNGNVTNILAVDGAQIVGYHLTEGTYILKLFGSPLSQPAGYFASVSLFNKDNANISIYPPLKGYITPGGVDTYTFTYYPTMTTAPVITKQVTFDTALSTIQGAYGAGCIKTSIIENDLTSRINQAVADLNAGDIAGAIAIMDGYLSTLNTDQSQGTIGAECGSVLVSDAQYLTQSLKESYVPPPPPPKLTLSPPKATLPIGTYYTMTATLTQGDTPLSGYRITVGVISGPNQDLVLQGNSTDANGQAVLQYTSKITGTDYLVAYAMRRVSQYKPTGDNIKLAMSTFMQSDIPYLLLAQGGGEIISSEPVEVTWSGGPDLAVDYFYPLFIRAKAGETITLTDVTGNYGNVPAGPSITRYYITQGLDISPATDKSLGQRSISALAPQQTSKGGLEVTLPADLTDTTYHLYACADADDQVIETDETNNCQRNRLVGYFVTTPGFGAMPGIASYCSTAKAKVKITGHEDERVAIITITGINAPFAILHVNGIKHGKLTNIKKSYVSGIGTQTVRIKLKGEERCEEGKKCEYVIGFLRNDSQGGICMGTVTIDLCKKKHKKEHEDKDHKEKSQQHRDQDASKENDKH